MTLKPSERSKRPPLAIVAFCLAVICALWIVILVGANRLTTTATAETTENARNFAMGLGEHVGHTIGTIDQLQRIIAAENTAPGLPPYLPDWAKTSPILTDMKAALEVIGPDGHVTDANHAFDPSLDLSRSPEFRQQRQAGGPEPRISLPQSGRAPGTWTIDITRRITRADGGFGGVVVVGIDPFYFLRFFEGVQLGANDVVLLVGRDGIVRARRAAGDRATGRYFGDSILFRQLRLKTNGVFTLRSRRDGIERVYGYAALPDYPLVVSVGVALSDTLAEPLQQRRRYYVVGAVLTLVLVWLALLLAHETAERRKRALAAQAEALLVEQKAILDTAVNAMRHGLVMFDKHQRLALANRAYREMYGLTPEQARPGMSPRELLESRIATGTFAAGNIDAYIHATIVPGHSLNRIFAIPDGRSIRLMNQVLEDGSWVSTHEDVTAQQHSEAALRASEERFRDIAEVAGDWIWETGPDHRLTYLGGRTLEELSHRGVSTADAFGKTRWELAGIDPESDPLWRVHVQQLRSLQPFREFRYTINLGDGARIHIATSGKPVFGEEGEFLGYRGTARDETAIVEARKRAEAAEAQLRDAVDSISEGFVIFDADDRLVACNDAYRRLYPKNAHLIVPGVPFDELLRAGRVNGEHPQILGGEEQWSVERLRMLRQGEGTFEAKLSDGRWIMVTERRTAHGGRAGLRIDITRLKAVQDELQASREALAAEAERSREMAANLANAHRVARIGSVARDFYTGKVEWSEEIYRILGLDPALPADYDRFLAMIHPDDRHLFDPSAAIGSANALPSFEYRVIRPDGAIRYVHREADAIFDQDGKPLKRITTMMDVTELRQAERELRASQEMLAWAQRTLGVGIITVNLATGEAKTSALFRALHGLSEATCPGPDMLAEVGRHVHPDDRAAWTAHVAAMHSKGACEPSEFRYIRPDDGREVWLREESDIILDENGRPVSQITTVRDVSARHAREKRAQELEKQLFHSQKLESLGRLAGGIAHDLNNTLAPILALSQFSQGLLPEGDAIRENLITISGAAERARDLVQRILAFARKQELHKRPTDLAALMRETLRMLRATVPATIALDSDIAEVPEITADAGQLQQVMVNLVTNAAHAIGTAPGRITLRLAHRVLGDGESVRLEIADTGCGMDAATLGRIFEPFFTTKDVGEGTGLGLAMVHGIVEGHGGTIDVESMPGAGTTFRITLPLSRADERAAA